MGTDVFGELRAVDTANPAARADEGGRVQVVAAWVEARALFIVAACAVIVLSLFGIPRHLSQDGWLALVAGRLIAAHGIPHQDQFTQLAHGVRWVDQQWLAQLIMYEVGRIGGLQLLTVLYVLVTGAAFTGGVWAARALGGEDLHVLASLLPGAFFYLVTAVSIRTQGLAYPLFVLVLWLLASEARSEVPRRRVWWVLPALVLWANLHGSVTLGAGMACLYGLTRLLRGRRSRGSGVRDARAWAFTLLPPLALLVTPYGLGGVHYYTVTLMNPQFGRMVTEWKPVISVPILAVPLALVIAVTFYTQVRAFIRGRAADVAGLPLFDVIVLLALAIGAVTAVRNVTWFGLALMILLPPAITRMKSGSAAPLRRARVNQLLAATMLAVAVITTLVILGRPTSWFTSSYPTSSLRELESLIARQPQAKVLADVRYADWLIWENPRLFSGRVAYDTSFELLNPRQLRAIADLAARDARSLLSRYRIWMLYPGNHSVNRTLMHRPGVTLVRRSREVLIAVDSRAGAP